MPYSMPPTEKTNSIEIAMASRPFGIFNVVGLRAREVKDSLVTYHDKVMLGCQEFGHKAALLILDIERCILKLKQRTAMGTKILTC